jgi:hypothetical protein
MNHTSEIEKLLQVARTIGNGELPPYEAYKHFTIGAFDILLINTEKGVAFDLLEGVCAKYDCGCLDGNFLNGYIFVVTTLARASNTTQLPAGMMRILTENPDITGELRAWYRISA